ncbi:hypothetical protein EDD21DRAFT_361405 [Dissophora ornata]|nr:hypothetical protein EDD21DRAFT_361405 [Dissophora ornata]
MDHYHDVYVQSAINLLNDIVRTNKGSFKPEEGKVRVQLASSALATQFYQALTKAQCVQELAITLAWEVTKEDLQRFAAAVTKANVVRVELNGCYPAKEEPDEVDSSLFQPILQLMSNGRIQAMDINTSNKQFLHVDVSIMKSARKLRVLSFDGLTSVAEGRSTLISIIENCRALSTLSIREGHANDVFQYMRRNLTSFRNLKTLTISEVRFIVALNLSQGKIDTIDASRLSSTYGEVEGLQEMLMEGRLTSMSLKLDGLDTDKDRYLTILQHNPKLRSITIPFYSALGLDIIGWTISARQDLIARGTPMQLRSFDLWKDIDTAINGCFLEFEGESSSFDLSIRIVLRSLRTYVDDNAKLFQEYGWSFMSLDAGAYTNADFNNLAQLLDRSTGKAGSKLESVHLNLAPLSCDGLESMDRVIARSYRLKYFRAILDVDDEELSQKCEWLFGRQGTSLNALILQTRASSFSWTSEIAKMFPPRSQLPALSIFDVSYIAVDEHAKSFAEWITDMVAAPLPQKQRELPPPTLDLPLNGLALSVPKPDIWTPLQKISFQHVFIPLGYWKAIFKTMDFTALSEVTFIDTGFTLKLFQTFVDCVPSLRNQEGVLPLERLLFHCECEDSAEFDLLENLVARLKLKAPRVQVTGLPDR